MKKYFQITFFLSIFFLLVLFRQLERGDETPIVAPINTPVPTDTSLQNQGSQNTPTPSQAQGMYKNGTYTGSTEDAYYGNIQVQVVIANGRITDVTFLQYPNDNNTSRFINGQAMPLLRSEALQAQSAQVDVVSGASDSSAAFQRSLGNALSQAK